MGCIFDCFRRPVMDRMAELEQQIYDHAQIPRSAVSKKYVTIQMSDGSEHDIWTVVIDSSEEGINEKPTLVMTHGFGSASCHYVAVFRHLMEHFKIVFFDNLSFGMNPRNG